MSRLIFSYSGNQINTPKREIGISVQFQTPEVFTSTYTTAQQTKNQLVNYILTNPGERLFNPAFGSGIRSMLFEQNADLEGMSQTLQDNIELYVQNIKVEDVNIVGGDSNDINIIINYSIQNIQDTLTVNLTNDTI